MRLLVTGKTRSGKSTALHHVLSLVSVDQCYQSRITSGSITRSMGTQNRPQMPSSVSGGL